MVAALLATLVVLLLTQSGARAPISVVTITTEPAEPAPPAERETATALLAALPDTVLSYSVTDQAASAELAAAPLEEWTLHYASHGAQITLAVGQWPTDAEAQVAFDALGDLEALGEVSVAGDMVGDVGTQGIDGHTERTIWRNGTAVFIATGPTGLTRAFYDAFPL